MTKSRPDTSEQEPCQIVIRRDGRVTFRMFTDDMLELAQALAPDDPRLRARASMAPARKRGAHEPGPDSGD